MHRTLTVGAALLAGAFISAASQAATHPSTTRRAAARPAKVDPVMNLVSAIALNSVVDGEDLYRACNRSSFKALAWALEGTRAKISISKSEYETEADFQARRRKFEDIINQRGAVIICQPLDDNEDAPFAYDAEREVFQGSFSAHQNVWRDTKRTGRYVSRTRMGIRATVTASVQIEYNVEMKLPFGERTTGCLRSNFVRYTYEVPIARADAPLVKPVDYLVFTGRLVAPFIDSSATPGSPTLDDPNDIYEKDLIVQFEPSNVAVVGPGGKKIYDCRIAQ